MAEENRPVIKINRKIRIESRIDVFIAIDEDQVGGQLAIIKDPSQFPRDQLDYLYDYVLGSRYPLRERNSENKSIPLPRERDIIHPGLYGLRSEITNVEASRFNMIDKDHISQILVLPRPGQEEQHALLPSIHGETGKTLFTRRWNSYLDDMLIEETEFFWFKGRSPKKSAFMANARANPPRKVLQPGSYTLWAMQVVERDTDVLGAPLVRWALVQCM